MLNKLNTIRSKYLIHAIYACSFLLAVLAVLGYMVWNKTVFIENKEAKIKSCITQAYVNYGNAWANSCKKNAEVARTALNNCIDQSKYDIEFAYSLFSKKEQRSAYFSKVAQCRRIYGNADTAPDCSLPAIQANNLENHLHRDKEFCSKISS